MKEEEAARPAAESDQKPRFLVEFWKEFVSGLVVVPFVWILARLFRTESGGLDVVAGPVILAWFAARGWKTEDATWPFRRDIWRFLLKFLFATLIVAGLPLLLYGIAYGCYLLFNFHRPPYALIGAYVAAVAASCLLIWIGRKAALRFAQSVLGLAEATVAQKARFTFYWLVALALVAIALWPEAPGFDELCGAARRAGSDLVKAVPATFDDMAFSECVVSAEGIGYAVTIGAVFGREGDNSEDIVHYTAVLYRDGDVHHIELISRDPRGAGAARAPEAPSVPERN